jgi:hypothetical protein
MWWWWMYFIAQVYASPLPPPAEQLMGARSLQEIRDIVGRQEEEKMFSRRCKAELRGNYLPVHCYLWLGKGDLSFLQKKYLLSSLDETCERRLKEGIAVGDKPLSHFAELSPRCRKSVKTWLSVKMYKLNRENTEKLFSKLETGSVFESVVKHAHTESVSQNRIPDRRTARRRLN